VISTARLNGSPHVHLQPINVIVYDYPTMEFLSCGQLRT